RLTGGGALRTLAGHGARGQPFIRFDLSPDGEWLSAGFNQGIEILNLPSQQLSFFFSMKGSQAFGFFSGGKSLLLFRTATGLERITIQSALATEKAAEAAPLGPRQTVLAPEAASVRHLAVSANGRTACLDLDDRRIMVVDLAGEREPVFLS